MSDQITNHSNLSKTTQSSPPAAAQIEQATLHAYTNWLTVPGQYWSLAPR